MLHKFRLNPSSSFKNIVVTVFEKVVLRCISSFTLTHLSVPLLYTSTAQYLPWTFYERSHRMFGRLYWNVQGTFLELRKYPGFFNVPKQCFLNVPVERSRNVQKEYWENVPQQYSENIQRERSESLFIERS